MDIVFIGDSLTFGYGVHKENSWVNLLMKNIKYTYLNKGVNGDTTVGILSRFYGDVIKLSPKYCFILCGTNDSLLHKDVNTIYDNILIMIKDCVLNSIFPVVLNPPFISEKDASLKWSPYPNYAEINNNLLTLGNKLNEYCLDNKILFIDLFHPTRFAYVNNKDIYLDGIHFNNDGHKLIYCEIQENIKNLANKGF